MIDMTPVKLFRIVPAVFFITLFVALFRLQVVQGKYYQKIAESNFVRLRRLTATRGEIYDHKYRPIVTNIPSHNLYLTSGKIGNLPALAAFLHRYFEISESDLRSMVDRNRFRTYEEILVSENIPYEMVLAISEDLNYYPELSFRIGSTRHYHYSNHFTGYVGRINESEFKTYRHEGYSLNSHIGKTGLERYYEVLLSGSDGREIVQVDALGRSLNLFRMEGMIPPVNGMNIILTIDNDLQTYASEIFPADRRGAIVVMDARSGGVLAYVSHPKYDPNLFMQRLSAEDWSALVDNPAKPMMDRVIHAAYQPGSVFKPITGSLGFHKGISDPNTRFSPCIGGLQIGNRFFRCWYAAGHGSVAFVDAIKVSCNVHFYDLSMKLDLDDFHDWTLKNHLAVETGIDLPNERRGFFPTVEWYRNTFGRNVSITGHKVNLSIGQAEVLTTPLQICAFYAAIANNGTWLQPHLLKSTLGRGRLTKDQIDPIKRYKLPISPQTMRLIHEGMYAVSNSPGGTATRIQVSGARVFSKTGSAENPMGKLTHAWYAGYIVTDQPEIVVTVFMENAGGGGSVSAPVANQIFNYYMGNYDVIKAPVVIPQHLRQPDDVNGMEDDPSPAIIEPRTPMPSSETITNG